jgi:biotin-dependent carboxylase-like uncharacterized protein
MRKVEVARVAGLATVQDLGRPGHMHEGVPGGGALVPELLARANGAVGNPPGAPAIELFGRITLQTGAELEVATEDGEVRVLSPGGELDVPGSPSVRVRYVAVRGGLDVPLFLGGRGTLLVAGAGGFQGRALRRGDRIPVATTGRVDRPEVHGPLELDRPIRIVAGPDDDRFEPSALRALLSSTFTVLASSDRVGTRLDGPVLSRRDSDDGLSLPMAPGAIEVPRPGPPIVLGPDHPTTVGYPVLAVVLGADLGRFAARHAGARVRFALTAR